MRTVLNEAGIEADWHNIWDNPDDAAFVRSVANGDETVPTLKLDGEVLVTPRPHDVVNQVARTHPELAVDQRRWPPLRIAQWVVIALLLVASNALARAGHEALSWALDAGAVATYFAFRWLRARPPARVRSRNQPSPGPQTIAARASRIRVRPNSNSSRKS